MKHVLYKKENHIATITINRPEALNAFNSQVIHDIIEAFGMVEGDPDVYCVILNAAGEKAFSAGGDIKEEIATIGEEALTFGNLGKQCIKSIQNCRVPVICSVQGYALGGGMEIILVCDITIAAENAKIGMPTIKLGTIPGWGSTKNLSKVVGVSRAKELLYTGRMVKAEEALRLGIVEFVVPKEELAEKTRDLAEQIADKAPIAMKTMKLCIDRGYEMDTESAYQLETEKFAMCYGTEDKYEAMLAFLEKREHKPYQYK